MFAGDGRFAAHRTFPLVLDRLLMQRDSLTQGRFCVKKQLNDPDMSLTEIRQRMRNNDTSLFNTLVTMSANVKGSPGFWAEFTRDLKAGLLQIGYLEATDEEACPPTYVFSSRSCAEYHWPELHRLFREVRASHAGNATGALSGSAIAAERATEAAWQAWTRNGLRADVSDLGQVITAHFDFRVVNYHNTVARTCENVTDVTGRKEYAPERGNVHWHCIHASPQASVAMNRARRAATGEIWGTEQARATCRTQLPSGMDLGADKMETFRNAMARRVSTFVTEEPTDANGGAACVPDGWKSLLQSGMHAAGGSWVTAADGTRFWRSAAKLDAKDLPRGRRHSCAQAPRRILRCKRATRAWRVGLHSTCRYHRCSTRYCLKCKNKRLLGTAARREAAEARAKGRRAQVVYNCRFNRGTFDAALSLVEAPRPNLEQARFAKQGPCFRFVPVNDQACLMAEPRAEDIWNGNSDFQFTIDPSPSFDAAGNIYEVVAYVGDYTGKLERHGPNGLRDAFRRLCDQLAGSTAANQRDGGRPNAPVSADPAPADPGPSSQHGRQQDGECAQVRQAARNGQMNAAAVSMRFLMRLAGAVPTRHQAAVGRLAGVPETRSTRRVVKVNLSTTYNRLDQMLAADLADVSECSSSDEERDGDGPAAQAAGAPAAQPRAPPKGVLNRFFAERDKPGRGELTLFDFCSRCSPRCACKLRHVVVPTGVAAWCPVWPLPETWAYAMLALFSRAPWRRQHDLCTHATFHQSLLAFGNLQETVATATARGRLDVLDDAASEDSGEEDGACPPGLRALVLETYSSAVGNPTAAKARVARMANKRRASTAQAAEDPTGVGAAVPPAGGTESEADGEGESEDEDVDVHLLPFAPEAEGTTGDTGAADGVEDDLTVRPPVPEGWDWHAAGRAQLAAALRPHLAEAADERTPEDILEQLVNAAAASSASPADAPAPAADGHGPPSSRRSTALPTARRWPQRNAACAHWNTAP